MTGAFSGVARLLPGGWPVAGAALVGSKDAIMGGGVTKEGGGKRKEYNGLKVFDRGTVDRDFQQQKKAKLWAEKKHADKKRAALNRLLSEMPESEMKTISGVFHDNRTENPHPDALESASSSDCSLSDEEVREGDIIFKDASLQSLWGPTTSAKTANNATARAEAGAKGKEGKSAKLDKAADKNKREGPASVGSFMEVPDWDEEKGECDGDGAGVDEGGGKRKGDKIKASRPEKVIFGEKQRPEVLQVLAKKADAKKKQIEQDRRAAQEARFVLETDEWEVLARERVGRKEREEVGQKMLGRKGMT